ncbi:MAG: DUF1178 family protein [Limnobacter sp.]|nr:DUF1178 family protein [Limnobacter sp.]
MATLIYDLECEYGHRFEGWFRSLQDYESQRESGLVACPECQTLSVRKVPSKLNIGGSPKSGLTQQAQDPSQTSSSPAPQEVKVATAFVLARQVMQALVRHSEDVGDNFAEEARKIYYEEAPVRAIRGHASEQECEELRDEGIDIIALPSLPRDEELN